MKKLSDMYVRLFYGSIIHARFHFHYLPEFKEFDCEIIKNLVTNVNVKVIRFQTNKTHNICFSDEEWDVCKRLIEAEAKFLDCLYKQGELISGAEDFKEHCLSVLGNASGRN